MGRMNVRKAVITIAVASLILLAGFLCWQSLTVNKAVPAGYTDFVEHYDPVGFMDFTHYCWYQYDSNKGFVDNEEYHKISSEEAYHIKGYFDNFHDVMEGAGRLEEYDFDDACVGQGDYVKVETKEGQTEGSVTYGRYDSYAVYYFDRESMRLYYLRSKM